MILILVVPFGGAQVDSGCVLAGKTGGGLLFGGMRLNGEHAGNVEDLKQIRQTSSETGTGRRTKDSVGCFRDEAVQENRNTPATLAVAGAFGWAPIHNSAKGLPSLLAIPNRPGMKSWPPQS